MPYVNKNSLRDEFDTLKSEFEQLSTKEKLSPEFSALFKALFMLFELMITVFMEKQTTKNNKNSGKPSSQTDKDETSNTGSKKKQRSEKNDIPFDNARTVETLELATVDTCEHCGEDLSNVPPQSRERRTKVDIVFEKNVSHIEAEIKTCPDCQMQTKGFFPADMTAPLQYGLGVKAYTLNLLVAQMVSLNRIQMMLKTLLGQAISEATLLNYVQTLHHSLEAWEVQSIKTLLTLPSLHLDETSMRVNKKTHWIHVYASGNMTLKFLQPNRSIEAIENIGIIPKYGGVMVHDCLAAYLSYDQKQHALCGSHLLRELTFIVEANEYRWARNMKRLLKATCKLVSKRKRKKLTIKEYTSLERRYRGILTRGEKELPPIPDRQHGKRGKVAKSDAHNLLERLRNHESAVLLFAKEDHVAFTNNRAERDLRMSKVKQKVSGCFRSEKYAHAYCRISSYLQTMSNLGYNPLVAIQLVLAGNIPKMGE